MPLYLDPKNDLPFKRVFGEHKNLCISLINSMLPLKDEVVSIEYFPSELFPAQTYLKNSIVDVRCKDSYDRQFVVEMQLYWTNSFMQRVLFNTSKAYVKQLDLAEMYETLKPVYSLNFVNAVFEPALIEFYHNYKIVNIANTERQIEGMEFVFVELPKFKPTNSSEDLQTLWLRYLTEINERTEKIPQELVENPEVREAVSYLQQGAYTRAELDAYDRTRDAIMTEKSALSDSKKEGIQLGIEQNSLLVAVNLSKSGFTVEQIANVFQTTPEEVTKLLH
ncbi:MAG: Rpn family recombination-promoting nuclease/putative transposase [Planctomycetaceae bacterium]|nr:Rpn family recombination-promoting nuclease/putative transposase [Planctomycetaceae bacterium]